MDTKIAERWTRILGGALFALVLLGIKPAPAGSEPRLLWRQDLRG